MEWKITIEERTKHDASFMQLGPVNGLLTGEKAREFFLKSNLPTPILGQIWGLADLNKDGKLDKKEFSIACCLIKRTLTNGQASLPSALPSSLLVEPAAQSATSPAQQQQPLSNSPLFNATFPSTSPVTPTQPQQPNLFPGLSMSNLTPLNQSNQSQRMVSTPQTQSNLVSTSGISMSMSSLIPGSMPTSFTQANSIPNPLAPIPSTSRMKYSQMFQSNDQGSTGYLNGQAAKTLLLQVGLPQPTLVQIWNLSDYDKDGKLSLEEFIIAMHLCDFAKAGNTLPMALPIELQPQRAKTATLPMTSSPSPVFNSPPQGQQQQPAQASSAEKSIYSFEDKRRENFDRGAAILEAKRQMLREQEERERKEREEKERLENERKQRIRDEQERRRQEEIQRQMERQRVLDAQREEERRKIFEQREAARNELLKQQRAEWERQKKQELENQKLKLQEQLNTLKAKDKNLEFDMQNLNEKISAYKMKISDTQLNLNELNNRLEVTRKNYLLKQSEMEHKQRELSEYQQNLARMRQEKDALAERQGGLRMDMSAPYGDELGRSNQELEAKQRTIQQLKSEMERMEQQISTTRSQMQGVKHELEESKTSETNFYRENDRLTQLIDLKRPGNQMKGNTSFGQSAELANAAAAHVAFKPSLSSNNIRSATPKENYDAFKEEITKIQQTTALINNSTQLFLNGSVASSPAQQQPQPQSQQQQLDPFASVSDPFANRNMQPAASANFSADWTSFGNSDPFASAGTDPFGAQPVPANNTFQSGFMNQQQPQGQPQSNSFQTAFMNNSQAISSSDFNGFDADDNWATAASVASTTTTSNKNASFSTTNNNTKSASTSTSPSSPKRAADAKVDAKSAVAADNHNDSSSFGANWANFDIDGAATTNQQSVTSPVHDPFAAGSDPFGSSAAPGGPKTPEAAETGQQANFSADWGNAFNKSDPFATFGADDNWAATAAKPTTNNATSPQQATKANVPTNNWASFNNDVPLNSTKFRAEYQFDASREDELTIMIGDIINVDLEVRTDEGWLYGECNGRVGVFPAAFTVKYSDWEAAMRQQQAFPQQQMYGSQSNQSLTSPVSPRGAPRIPTSGSFRSNKSFSASQSFPSQAALNSNLNNTQLSNIKNYFISIYPYTSTEIGDLVFREFEIINVIDQNEDWLTGQIVGSGSGPANPLRAGIFPSNFVIKFDFPIEYIGKYTIGMATEAYQASNGGELTLNPAESQLIAIKKVSPDGQWSYGESFDANRAAKKGWFPIQSALALIDAGVAPLYVPTSNPTTSATSPSTSTNNVAASNSMGNINKSAPNSVSYTTSTKSPSVSSISLTPPPPTANSTAKVASPPPVTPTKTTQSFTTTTSTTLTNNNAAEQPSATEEPTTVNTNTPTTNTNTNTTSSSSSAASTTKSKATDVSTPAVANANSTTTNSKANSAASKANKHVSSTPKPNNAVKKSTSQEAPQAEAKPEVKPQLEPEVDTQTTANNNEASNQQPQLPAGVIDQVVALYDFASTTPETIGFPKDAVINIIEKSGDWWLGEYQGKMGLLPYNYVQSILKESS